MAAMRVLVTGSDGYIGAVLGPTLLEHGYAVSGVDCGFYRDGWLYDDGRPPVPTRSMDIRKIAAADLEGFAAVVHLAELSNDPLGQLDPRVTRDINHGGSLALARACRAAGVSRFVYASSCSVYGAAAGGPDCDERSEPNPQTEYARCKVLVERDVGALADATFSPVFLRNATAFGISPRMRFDIVLNNLAGLAWTTREIRMTSDGTPWRPLVHVDDICQAIRLALEVPRENIHNEILNVGDDAQNHRIAEIAGIVANEIAGCTVTFGRSGGDGRSYRASFGKIGHHLPDFRCGWGAERGARQLHDLFRRVRLTDDLFSFRGFTRLEQIRHLIAGNRIDADFYWQPLSPSAG